MHATTLGLRVAPLLLAAALLTARAAFAAPPVAAGAPAAPPDWDAASAETTTLLQKLIRVRSVNPPGGEAPAAKILLDLFRRNRIESGTVECVPSRTNVWARVPGDGSMRPLVLSAHLDVVPVEDPAKWKVDPFSGAVKDGFVWGRGALDMKGYAAQEAEVLLLLHRRVTKLARDVIFVGTADEESGAAAGADCVTGKHADLLRGAEWAITEPQFIPVLDGKPQFYAVGTEEKAPLWIRITASGEEDHAAYVGWDYAAKHLVAALGRILAWQPPLRVLPDVQTWFTQRAATEKSPWKERFADLRASLADPEVEKQFESQYVAGYVRDTVALTQIEGSRKENSIAGKAWALLDCRLLPGSDPQALLAKVKELAADPSLTFETPLSWAPSSSPADGEPMKAIQALARRDDPGVPVFATMTVGFTDCHAFRAAGVGCYGFEPWKLTDDVRAGVHGVDERIPVSEIHDGNRRLYEIVLAVAGSGPEAASFR